MLHHEVAQDVLADGVDDVQDDEQHRDEQDVAVAEHERERVALLEGRLGRGGPGRGGDRARAAPVHRHVEDEGEEQQPRRQVQHQVRAHVGVEETPGGPGPDRAARGRADPDDGEEPVARVLRVDVVRVRPELRDDRQAEEAHPHVERHADEGHSGVHRDREGEDVRREEERHPDDQLHPVDARREPAVGGHEGHEHERLTRGGEGLHLGRAVDPERPEEAGHLGAQDERLADGLDHVVRDEDQEHVHEHEEGAAPSPGWTSEKRPRRRSRGPGRPGAGEAAFVLMSPALDAAWECRGRRIEEHTGFGAPRQIRRWQETDSRPGRPRLDSTVDPWRLWDAFETGVGSGGAGRRHGRRRARRGDADGGRRPAVQGRRVPRVRVRQGVPRPVDDPDRGARPRPAEDRRRD